MDQNEIKINPTSFLVALTALILLSFLKRVIINVFLAFTTVFPFVLILSYFGTDAKPSHTYQSILSGLVWLLYRRTLEDITTAQMIGLFFTVLFALSVIISGVQYLVEHIWNIEFKIKITHIIALMTVVYLVATSVVYFKEIGDGGYLFILVFYLFNIYSIISYKAINKGINQLRSKVPSLSHIPF